MFSRNKTKNRRLNRRHVLDVKLRSDQIRKKRMRLSAVALAVSFGTIFGLYILWRAGNWALNTFLYENKAFAIEQVDVQTDGVIAPDQLRRWCGVKTGDNLLALDLTRVKRDLELVPLIQSAGVERLLPHTLRVRITEREPVAQVYIPQPRANGGYDMTLFHLDPEGYVMLPLDPRQRSVPAIVDERFSLIAGLNAAELRPGKQVDSPQLRAALELILLFERSAISSAVELQRVDLSSPGILQITTTQGSEVTFSMNDLEQQLRRWNEIYEQGKKFNKAIASLDLAVTNNIPARWAEASATPFSPPKPKLPRTKKRNA
jgi:cell division septal protein FtsQ